MERLIATMQSLTGNVSDALERSSRNEKPKLSIDNAENTSPITPSTSPENDIPQSILTNLKLSSSGELEFGDPATFDDCIQTYQAPADGGMNTSWNIISQDQNLFNKSNEHLDFSAMGAISDFGSLSQHQIPGTWSFSYQMGTEAYATARDQCEDLKTARRRNWPETNSPFSDHIRVLQTLLKNKINAGMSLLDPGVGA